MTEKDLDIASIKSYWIKEADEALIVAEHLIEKEDYSYSLFFGHLALEKMLKAIYVDNNNDHAPPIHNLQRLAKLAKLALDEDKKGKLLKITSFNIESRYPDIKRSFRKKCTKDFTQGQMEIIKEIFQWLKKMMT